MADAPGIRIHDDAGKVVGEIPREPLEWARNRASGAPFSLTGPVCSASSSSLRIAAAGKRATVCRFAASTVGDGESIDAVWHGSRRKALAAVHRKGVLPATHCGACIRDLETKLWHATGIIREHSDSRVVDSDHDDDLGDALQELVCVVAKDDDRDSWREALGALSRLPPRMVIEVADPAESPALREILSTVAADSDGQTQIELRAARLPTVPEADGSSLASNPRIECICVTWSVDYEANLRRAAALAPAARLRVAVNFGPTNWFDLLEITQTASRLGATVDLRLDRGAVRALPLVEQRFLVGVAADNWQPFSGDACPPSLSATAYDELLLELNFTVRAAARDAVHDCPESALSGEPGARLAWPRVDHDALRDPDRAVRLTNRVLDLAGSPSVQSWVEAATVDEDRGFDPLDEAMPWLSLVVQSVAIHCASEPAAEWLRTRFDDPLRAEELLASEHGFAARGGYEGWADYFHEHLGLRRLSRRAPPFTFEPAPVTAVPDKVDVTVLVPSFRHEQFIVDTLRSVLAQSYPNFRLLVVDDRSDDATVERARSLEDPRLEIRVNPTNLGLGNSVRSALADCETPFVALLNSDDLFHPERLERCRQALLDNPGAQLVATDLHLIDSEGGALHADNASRLRDGAKVFDWVGWFGTAQPERVEPEHLFGDLLASNFLATSTNLFCRTDFLRAQTQTLERLKYCLDWQLCLEAARTAALLYLPDRLAAYRLHRSNTVWFREGRRWTYYLEVNRVVASTLSRYLADTSSQEQAECRLATLKFVAKQLTANTEVDGYGLFLNRLLGGVALEELSQREDAQALVQTLHERAERSVRIHYAVRDRLLDDSQAEVLHRVPSLEVANLLAEIVTDELVATRGRIDQLDLRAMRAEHDLREVGRDRDQAAGQFRHYHEIFDQLAAALAENDSEASALTERPIPSGAEFGAQVSGELPRLQQLEWRLRRELEARQRLEQVRVRLELDVVNSRKETEAARQRLGARIEAQDERLETQDKRLQEQAERIATLRQQMESVRTETDGRRAELRSRLEEVRGQLATSSSEFERSQAALETTRCALADERAERQRVTDQRVRLRAELETLTEELQTTKDAWRFELEELYKSREWRLGSTLWGKIPGLRKASRLVGGAERRVRDRLARNRLRSAQRHLEQGQPNIVAAATAHFPIYSHTFVYQELAAMHSQLGANVQLFYRFDSEDAVLPASFEYLDRHKARIDATHGTFRADLARFRRKSPERVASLFEAIGEATCKSVDELELDDDLLGAFSFARRVDTVRPDYLHSYFFYEQSLGALVAKWLLHVPRGVSAYADHMLEDWPFKLVPLHLQTSDVVVATSERIREELCVIAGSDEHADKILVKPNGVDGTRFPFAERPERLADQPLELLSVSRLERKKGLVELVDAVAALRDRYGLDVLVHVVGTVAPATPANVAYGDAFRREIHNQGLVDSVRLHGFRDQAALQPLLARCHAFIAPYVETDLGDKDGIPTAVLEAMSAGLPVLASDAGSLAEVITDGIEGWIVPKDDPEALILALRELHARSTSGLRTAGRQAHVRFEKEFDVRVTEPRLHERIRAAITRSGDRAS